MPGDGIGDFAISDDGSKVAYQQSDAQNMWLIETAHPGVETRLGNGGLNITMDAAGTRVFYAVIPFTPSLQPSAIFSGVSGGDGYVLRGASPGGMTLFSGGTPSGRIRMHTPTTGGQSVLYLRTPAFSTNADLYRVDMSNPAVSTPMADHSTQALGIISFALSPDASQLFYATLDRVPIPGGGGSIGPGNADIYLLPANGSAARHLQHFDENSRVGKFAPDGGYAVVEQGILGLESRLHAFNALDPGQNIVLNTLPEGAGVDEYLFVVAP